MNIFALSNDPETAATYHCEKHVIKQLLEVCQILSTNHRLLDGIPTTITNDKGKQKVVYVHPTQDSLLYKLTHQNHPSTIWARQSIENYKWTAELLKYLCVEYTRRYGKVHKCERIGLVDFLVNNVPKNLTNSGLTPFAMAMPEYIRNMAKDPVDAYRLYYVLEKQRMIEWKSPAIKPHWVKEYQEKYVCGV
jgi:hypothetical protein